ncbi:MAG: ABC transporter permease subunit [Anaerolineales bacterium]
MRTPKPGKAATRSLRLGAAVLAGLVIYAYGFQVTKVDLEETRLPRRREGFVRILRALARPDLFVYEKEEFVVEAPIYVPCPQGAPVLPPTEGSDSYLIIEPRCAEPGGMVHVEGFGLPPNTAGPLSFIPPSGVQLHLGNLTTDPTGHFALDVSLPKRSSTEPQHLRAVARRNVGWPRISQTARDTWDKIIETVFLALLATTLGTLLAIPTSFLAAKNIMRDVRVPLASASLAWLAVLPGVWLGSRAAGAARDLGTALATSVPLRVALLVGVPVLVFFVGRWALPAEEERRPPIGLRLGRLAALLGVGLAGLFFLYLVSAFALEASHSLTPRLGSLGFLAKFVGNLAEILTLLIQASAALGAAGLLASAASRLGTWLSHVLAPPFRQIFGAVSAAAAGAVLMASIGAGIDWVYQLGNSMWTLWIPAGAGALLGLVLAVRSWRLDELPIGMTIYFAVRTILNTLRSIEALVMAIVFVVWVGIGPFAGVLALSLHTVAALAKLYSEQVESILPGPVEAVTATGATRLQTIVYAVVPQIVPPYISFTMYRWDINVRMSTIIGFAGGGGIGFLLQQNINLLNYRAASAQMLAITLVVASMDYLSSRLRERAI